MSFKFNPFTGTFDIDEGLPTGTPVTISPVVSGELWTQIDGVGNYYCQGGTHAIRVYAYKNIGSQKVFSTMYQFATQYSNYTGGAGYFQWDWDAVAGADGYRVFLYADMQDTPPVISNYEYYADVTTNQILDGDGVQTWTYGSELYLTSPTTTDYSNTIDLNGRLDKLRGVNEVYVDNASLFINKPINPKGYLLDGVAFVLADAGNMVVGKGSGIALDLTASGANTIIGSGSGIGITTGKNNVILGGATGNALTSGEKNFILGVNAGANLTTGSENIVIGEYALTSATDNYRNIAIGYASGQGITGNGASNNICIGQGGFDTAGAAYSNCVGIGMGYEFNASNQLCFGGQTAPLLDAYFGGGVMNTGYAYNITINPSGRYPFSADAPASTIALVGGVGTGYGQPGVVYIKVPKRLGTATGQATWKTRQTPEIKATFHENELRILDGYNLQLGTTTGTKIGTATTEKIGFWNKTPVVQPTALTTQLTTITHTAPGTPDYAIQDFTQATPWGFASHDEANSVLKVIANLQTRVSELETKLQSIGVLA